MTTTPDQHAAGTEVADDGRPRGLCWCGWRGQPYDLDPDGHVLARLDADHHANGLWS